MSDTVPAPSLAAGDPPVPVEIPAAGLSPMVEGTNVALRVALDPQGLVEQCGPDVEANDAACIQLVIEPGSTASPIDCSVFD